MLSTTVMVTVPSPILHHPACPILANSSFASLDYFQAPNRPYSTASTSRSRSPSSRTRGPVASRTTSLPQRALTNSYMSHTSSTDMSRRSRTEMRTGSGPASPGTVYCNDEAMSRSSSVVTSRSSSIDRPTIITKAEYSQRRSVQLVEKANVNWARPLRASQSQIENKPFELHLPDLTTRRS